MSLSVVASMSLCFLFSPPVMGDFEDSSIYHYQPSSSTNTIRITPPIPGNNFRAASIIQEIDVSTHHYNRFNTYIFLIAGRENCNRSTIVGLEYCVRERQEQRGNMRSYFDFFTMKPMTETSEAVLRVSYKVTASSVLMTSNCSNIPRRSTMVCCSYQDMLNSQLISDASHFGITNIQEYPTLLRIPDFYKTSYFYKPNSIAITEGETIDLRPLSREDNGDVPNLRLYYDCPTNKYSADSSTAAITLTTGDRRNADLSTTDNTTVFQEPQTGSSSLDLKWILLTAGLVGGGAILFLLVMCTITITLVTLRRRKKTGMKHVASSSNENIYNTLHLIRPKITPTEHYSVLEPEWLQNNAYQSHSLEEESHRESAFQGTTDGEEQLLQTPYYYAGQRNMPSNGSRYSANPTEKYANYATVKRIQPQGGVPLQRNIAYGVKNPPAYVNVGRMETEHLGSSD